MLEPRVAIYLTTEAVFPGTETSLEELRRLVLRNNAWKMLSLCSQILNFLELSPGKQLTEIQKELVASHLTNTTHLKLVQFEMENPGSRIVVFFRTQVVHALRWILLFSTNIEDTAELSVDKDDFLKILLVSADRWAARVYGSFKDDLESAHDERSQYAVAFRRGYNATRTLIAHNIPIARATELIELRYARILSDFNSVFFQSTGILYENFLLCQVFIWTNLMANEKKAGDFRLGDSQKSFARIDFEKFLDVMCFSVDALKSVLSEEYHQASKPDEFSLRPWRQRPLLIDKKQRRILVLDPILFIESMVFGPVFTVANVIGADAIALLGRTFELYVDDILRSVFPEHPLLKRLVCDEKIMRGHDEVGQVDAYIIYDDKVILIESKTAFVNELVVLNNDVEGFLSEVDSKFIESKNKDAKGINQLFRTISYLQDGTWSGRNGELLRCKTIVPVIVTNDPLLCDGIIGNHLGIAFQKLFDRDNAECLPRFEIDGLVVENIIMISLDDIELLEYTLENTSFADLLLSYSQRNPDRLVSFFDFLVLSNNSLLRDNRRMNETSKSKIGELMRRMEVSDVAN